VQGSSHYRLAAVHDAHSGGAVGEIGDLQLIFGAGVHELSMDGIQRPFSNIRREGRALLAFTNHAAETVSTPQPFD
jgi:hypothetical protein